MSSLCWPHHAFVGKQRRMFRPLFLEETKATRCQGREGGGGQEEVKLSSRSMKVSRAMRLKNELKLRLVQACFYFTHIPLGSWESFIFLCLISANSALFPPSVFVVSRWSWYFLYILLSQPLISPAASPSLCFVVVSHTIWSFSFFLLFILRSILFIAEPKPVHIWIPKRDDHNA